MRSVEDHQRHVASLLRSPRAVPRPLSDALGLILASDVFSPVPLPPFDNSAMDGYAVRAQDCAQACIDEPVILPVSEDIPAGVVAQAPLMPQSVHRIMTGAALPLDADAIVPFESTDRGATTVRIHAPTTVGAHIRRKGEDIPVGGIALTAGTRLLPPHIGLLAALGLTDVPVFAPARVMVVATGSELTPPGVPLLPGSIYESNSPMLAAAVRHIGGHAVPLPFVSDNVQEFRHRLDTALHDDSDIDLIITSGGVSAGEYEVVKQALTTDSVDFFSVAMQPGKPQGCGYYHSSSGSAVPLVALPGNPVSAQVSFTVFLQQPLLAIMGTTAPSAFRVTLAEEVQRSPIGKRQFLRGILSRDRRSVVPFGPPGSHFLRSMAHSNCLVDIPESVSSIPAGSSVEVWDLS